MSEMSPWGTAEFVEEELARVSFASPRKRRTGDCPYRLDTNSSMVELANDQFLKYIQSETYRVNVVFVDKEVVCIC
jgi:hypothetical protein